jgi:hypothetical protein
MIDRRGIDEQLSTYCEMTQKGSSESWLMAMLTAVDSSSSSLYYLSM